MKTLQVNSLGEYMNVVIRDISVNQASSGWAFHIVKQMNQWQWCRAVGKSVEKKPWHFVSQRKKSPVLCCFVTFLFYLCKRENNAEDHLEEDSHFIGPSWRVARNEKWARLLLRDSSGNGRSTWQPPLTQLSWLVWVKAKS